MAKIDPRRSSASGTQLRLYNRGMKNRFLFPATPMLSSLRCLCFLLFISVPLRPARSQEASYDLVVYGGTSGGVAAAIQARRMGKTAVVIEPGRHLGGLTSGGLGATDIGNKAAIGGISREFYQRIKKHYLDRANWKHEKPENYRSG